MSNKKPTDRNPPAGVRVYANRDPDFDEDALDDDDADESLDAEGLDVISMMLQWRRAERDLAQIAKDPTQLPGYDRLPAGVQLLAGSDPIRFWLLWQLGQSGVDLHEVDAMRAELHRQVDDVLREDGWDGVTPPTDEQLERAGATVRERLQV